MVFTPVEILIERGLENAPAARRAVAAAPCAAVESFDGLAAILARLEGLPAVEAKKRLVVARRAGGFVKEFPLGLGIAKNGWRYFIPAIGCPADCRYCFLQTYHPANAPVVFVDSDAMLAETEAAATELGGGYFYGGELCDDLMLEPFVEAVGPLVSLFRRLPSATLELRTKSAAIDPLIAAGGARNVIISWTFSPEGAVRLYELGTAPLSERIQAARRAQKCGFRVGIRMDPVILTDGWQESYMDLVEGLAASLDPEFIESVHIGALRYTQGLKSAVLGRFGPGGLLAREFALSSDGKYRYPRPVRVAAYAEIARMVMRWNERVRIRLCMETPAVERDFGTLLA
jgi:spore photoproduct lyase